VFHSPQLSQRPAHLGEADPQDWQTYVVTDLTTPLDIRTIQERKGAEFSFA
jgi:hypothetical protein